MGKRVAVFLLFGAFLASPSAEAGLELFGKGSFSKSYFSEDSYILSVSGSGGAAITLFTGIRLEGRYTNSTSLQNVLSFSSGAFSGRLNDVLTQTAIYSVGVDFDLLGKQSTFQPFLYVGVGYVKTDRSYYFLDEGSATSYYIQEPTQTAISGNLGLGFRLYLANSIALEAEAFAYGMNIHLPRPLVNLLGSVGIRLFI